MSIPGLAVALLLCLVALAIVARPLLRSARPERRTESRRPHQRERLEQYYRRLLTNIRDLDEDFATGKISDSDYQAEREVWMERGIRLLRVMDELEREASPPAEADDAERIDRAIDEALAEYRAALRPKPEEDQS